MCMALIIFGTGLQVFDGHCGGGASSFARDNLLQFLKESDKFPHAAQDSLVCQLCTPFRSFIPLAVSCPPPLSPPPAVYTFGCPPPPPLPGWGCPLPKKKVKIGLQLTTIDVCGNLCKQVWSGFSLSLALGVSAWPEPACLLQQLEILPGGTEHLQQMRHASQ